MSQESAGITDKETTDVMLLPGFIDIHFHALDIPTVDAKGYVIGC